jgi:hypothetical protein
VCKLVLDEDTGTRIIDPVRPNFPAGAGKLRFDGKIEISVEIEIFSLVRSSAWKE